MRETDEVPHPMAVARRERTKVELIAGLVIAAAGLLAVFLLKEVYIGFSVALIGAGYAPLREWMKK